MPYKILVYNIQDIQYTRNTIYKIVVHKICCTRFTIYKITVYNIQDPLYKILVHDIQHRYTKTLNTDTMEHLTSSPRGCWSAPVHWKHGRSRSLACFSVQWVPTWPRGWKVTETVNWNIHQLVMLEQVTLLTMLPGRIHVYHHSLSVKSGAHISGWLHECVCC